MKFKIYLFLVFAFLFAAFTGNRSSSALPAVSGWEAMNLKGKIKAMCQCDFNATAHGDVISKLDETPVTMDSTWFDDKGNRVKEDKFGAKGQLLSEYTCKFDSNENLLESKNTRKNKVEHKEAYKYDDKGHVTENILYKGGDSLYEKDSYKYDDKGLVIEKDVDEFFPVKKTTKHFYELNANGDKVKENVFVIGKSVGILHSWKYDGNSNMVEQDDYSLDGRITAKILQKYDAQGNMTEYGTYNSDGSLSAKRTDTYNMKGYKTEEDWYRGDGQKTRYYTYGYDDKGNQTQYKQYNVYKDDTQMEVADTYLFEYDKKDNWVKKTDLKIDGTITVTEREIMYY